MFYPYLYLNRTQSQIANEKAMARLHTILESTDIARDEESSSSSSAKSFSEAGTVVGAGVLSAVSGFLTSPPTTGGVVGKRLGNQRVSVGADVGSGVSPIVGAKDGCAELLIETTSTGLIVGEGILSSTGASVGLADGENVDG